MLLKMMGGWAIPDHDTRQTFRMVARVSAVHFERLRAPDEAIWSAEAMVTFENGEVERFRLNGNAYLMNNEGKTVATFAKEAPPDEAWDYQFTESDPPSGITGILGSAVVEARFG